MEDESISSESVRSESSATSVSDTKLLDELIQKQQALENENIKLKSNLLDSRQKIERLTTPALCVYQDDPIKRNMFKEKVGEDIFNRIQSHIETLNFSKEQADKWGDSLMEGAQDNNIDINVLRTDVIYAFKGMGNQEMANRALYMNLNELLTCDNVLKAGLRYLRQRQQENIPENTPNKNQVAQQPLKALCINIGKAILIVGFFGVLIVVFSWVGRVIHSF